jgi:hypothetical protein
MRKLSLAAVAAMVVLGSFFAPSLIARQQTATRFEYLRVAPYGGPVQQRGHAVLSTFLGYRACIAASADGFAATSRQPIQTHSETFS